eukprot:1545985-Rhodomonas_salina.1
MVPPERGRGGESAQRERADRCTSRAAYARATRCPGLSSYAFSGTDMAKAATMHPNSRLCFHQTATEAVQEREDEAEALRELLEEKEQQLEAIHAEMAEISAQ